MAVWVCLEVTHSLEFGQVFELVRQYFEEAIDGEDHQIEYWIESDDFFLRPVRSDEF